MPNHWGKGFGTIEVSPLRVTGLEFVPSYLVQDTRKGYPGVLHADTPTFGTRASCPYIVVQLRGYGALLVLLSRRVRGARSILDAR
jgi:hypothetical protein